MKIVPLKIVPITSNEFAMKHGFSLDYQREFLGLVERFPQGITIEQMTRFQSLNRALRAAEGKAEVVLEDADAELLEQRLKAATFTFYAEEIFRMAADLANAPAAAEDSKAHGAMA